jgi:hypothetical protein
VLLIWLVGTASYQLAASIPRSSLQPPQPTGLGAWTSALGTITTATPPLHTTIAAAIIGTGICVASFVWLYVLAGRQEVRVLDAVILSFVSLIATAALPLLYSRDVFSYAMYGNIVWIHHADPFALVPARFPDDPYAVLIGPDWRYTTSVYGPVFVLVSGAVSSAVSSVIATVIVYKAIAIAATTVVVVNVAKVASRYAPASAAQAVVAVGLNPVVIYATVAGAHNDTIVAAGLVIALGLSITGRRWPTTAVLAATSMIKIVALVPAVLWIAIDVARTSAGQRTRRLIGHLALLTGVLTISVAPFWDLENPTLGQSQLLSEVSPSPGNWLREVVIGSVHAITSAASYDTGQLFRFATVVALVAAIGAVGASSARRAAAGDALGPTLAAGWGWALIVVQLLSLVFYPWYMMWTLPFLWSLPRTARTYLIAISAVQMFLLVVADRDMGHPYWLGLWISTFVLAPTTLLLSLPSLRVLIGRVKHNTPLVSRSLPVAADQTPS